MDDLRYNIDPEPAAPQKVGDVVQLMTPNGLTRFVVTHVDPETGEVTAKVTPPH